MINLLPPETKQSIRYARLNVILIQYCFLVAFISVLVFAMLIFGMHLTSMNEKEVETSIREGKVQLTKYNKSNKEAEELAKSIDTISALLKREVKFSQLLKDIGAIMPKGAALSTLTISESREEPLVLEAYVVNESAAAVLRENLAESKLFSDADIMSITASEGDGPNEARYGYTARLQAYFEGAPTPKPKTATKKPVKEAN